MMNEMMNLRVSEMGQKQKKIKMPHNSVNFGYLMTHLLGSLLWFSLQTKFITFDESQTKEMKLKLV